MVTDVVQERPLASLPRYASPSFRTKSPGEWLAFETAYGLSFPRGDVSVIRFTRGRAGFQRVVAAREQKPVLGGATLSPFANCGCQKSFGLTSFQIMTSLIVG